MENVDYLKKKYFKKFFITTQTGSEKMFEIAYADSRFERERLDSKKFEEIKLYKNYV